MLKAWTTPVFDGEILVQWSQFLLFFSISISHMGGIPYCGWWNSPSKYWWFFYTMRVVFLKTSQQFHPTFSCWNPSKTPIYHDLSSAQASKKKQFRSKRLLLKSLTNPDFCGLNPNDIPQISGAEITQIPSHLKPWNHQIRTFSVLKHPIYMLVKPPDSVCWITSFSVLNSQENNSACCLNHKNLQHVLATWMF